MSQSNSGASQEAIEFHYDMPANFFQLWLGNSMTYTAARFTHPEMSLDAAQANKIAYHLDAAGVASGSRVLDVGCGWGSLLKSALMDRDASSAVGLTLSPLQHAYIEDMGVTGLDAELKSYEHFEPDRPFESIVSVGAFEHFTRPGATRAERMRAYAGFFERCANWLTQGGQLSLQTMTWGDAKEVERDHIKIHDIFPESDLPEIAEVVEAANPYFELMSMENRPDDYAATLAAWGDALHQNREHAINIVGLERFSFYLKSCKGGAILYRRRRFYLCRFQFRLRGR
ncbi:MAG: class I SAM-dependent methyltransferase [Pseudomonadota bacterium]